MAKARSQFIIDRSVQGALAKRVVAHWCCFFALTVLSLMTLEYFLGDPSLTFAGHANVVWGKYAFFFILMLAIMPTFIYDTLKMSNRFAGPIHRLKVSLRGLADGSEEVSDLKFRENDFWRELSEDFNRVKARVSQAKAD